MGGGIRLVGDVPLGGRVPLGGAGAAANRTRLTGVSTWTLPVGEVHS